MYPFVETLRIENRKIINLSIHNERFNRTRRELFDQTQDINLKEYLTPELYPERTKCRIEYQEEIGKVEYIPYQLRIVRSLQMVVCDDIDYSYKSTNREKLNQLFALKGKADDILIIKNGFLTDTSFSNIVLWNGKEWHTPSTPLLKGTMRSLLLYKGKIKEKEIKIDDLKEYSKIHLINAMIDFGEIEIQLTNESLLKPMISPT